MAENHLGVNSIASIPSNVEGLLRQTMVLGLPTEDADKPTFHFARQVSWADYDSAEQPWDWTAAPVSDNTPPPVKPICAVEFFAPIGRSGSQFTEVGDFFASTVLITLSDTDYPTVVNSSYVTFGPSGTKYWFRYWRPGVGLGNLNFYQALFAAEDTA